MEVPYSLEAEQSIIGAILLNNNAIDDVVEVLSEEDFFKGDNRKLYHYMLIMRGDNDPIDLITLSEKTGGDLFPYIAEIMKNTPSASNVMSYARVVADKATERRILKASNTLSRLAYDTEIEVDMKLDKAESELMMMRRESLSDTASVKEIMRNVIDELEYLHKHKGEITGLATGFAALDRRFSGLRAADFWVIAARPSMGKSAFVGNIMEHNAIQLGKPVLMFNLEMSKEDVIKRMICSQGRIDFEEIRNAGCLTSSADRLFAASNKIAKSNLIIDDCAGITINEIKSRARKVYKKNPDLACVIVDYLQLVVDTGDAHSREQHVSNVSRNLKLLAKELKIPVIALAQLNRGVEQRADKRPLMSDLRDSGAIEQDADIVSFLYRDEVYNPDTQEQGICQVLTRKFRNGSIGVDYLGSALKYMKFDNTDYLPAAGMNYSGFKAKGSYSYS